MFIYLRCGRMTLFHMRSSKMRQDIMRKNKRQKISLALLAILLIILLVGCGNSRPELEDVLASASDAIGEVSAYRIEMTLINTENGETTRASTSLEYVLPDRVHTVTVYEEGSEESIRIGQTEYYRDAGSDSWQVRQWPESVPFPIMSAGWVELLGSMVELVEMADEEIDGVDCYHYRGSVDMKAKGEEEIAKLDPAQPEYEHRLKALEVYDHWQLQREFWIGKEDYLLRQLEQHQEIYITEDPGEDTEKEVSYSITATFRFFDFNQHIQIELPVAESVE